MGINYYLKTNCGLCGHTKERHIGKNSSGWYFSLHIYPEDNISDIFDWIHVLKQTEHIIEDEDGEVLTPIEMLGKITIRDINWKRHGVDGKHCIRRGIGTYDYFIGEFS